MASLALMIVFIVITLGLFGFGIFKAVKLIKYPMPKTIKYPKEIKKLFFIVLGVSAANLMLFIFLAMWQTYPMKALDWVQYLFGALLFGFVFPTFVLSFMIHYYAKEVDEKSKKLLFISMLCSGIVSVISLILLTNGVADYIPYPLVNGLNFQQGFVTPASSVKPNLAWYAICILSGAVLVLAICDHRFFKEYGKHGILESTFFIAFPAGIIGARIGYVIGEWEHGGFAQRVANGEWWSIFAVWEGGLTVISGALVGIIVGVIWFVARNRKYSIWLAMDVIIPCILVAQSIGRWGNCFNCEVHGNQVLASDWWFLPKMVLNNARYSESMGYAASGYIWAPLFFVESVANLAGYFFIRFALGKGLKKYLELGDLAASYIVWYGLTRTVMEPMRNTTYNMGNDGYWSWLWSIMFVLIGSALIAINHIVRFVIRKKQKKEITYKEVNYPVSFSISGVILGAGLALTILGSIFMVTSTQSAFLGFNRYNNGLIMLTIGLSVLLMLAISITYLLQGKKKDA